MLEEYKEWIDNANYEDLLRRWRFAANDMIFTGDNGKYYVKIMEKKKMEVGHNNAVATSKRIEWDPPK